MGRLCFARYARGTNLERWSELGVRRAYGRLVWMVEMVGLLEFDACGGRISGVSGYGVPARIACDMGGAWGGSGALDMREGRT